MPSRDQVLAQISRYLQQLPVEERYLAVYELNEAARNSQSINESTEFERRRTNWREQNAANNKRRKAIEAALGQ